MDGSSRFNLATFCGTWMEPEAQKLMAETFDKNMIDKDEYPQTAELEMRCVHMLAELWHSPDPEGTLGTSTIGSSEACMLGGLALKWRWREKMRKAGKSADRPNLVMGTNTQVCWHKFVRYWDVEERAVPLEGDSSVTDPERAAAMCDENTIGVVAVLGSTFTGDYEDVEGLSAALDRLAGEDRARYPDPRGWRQRGLRGALPATGDRLGFPPAAGEIHQHIRPQIRPGVSGRWLGDLEGSRRTCTRS